MNELSNVPVPVPESSSSSIGAIKGQIEVGGIGSLEVLDATDLSLVPDISIAANTAELDDVDNFLSMSGVSSKIDSIWFLCAYSYSYSCFLTAPECSLHRDDVGYVEAANSCKCIDSI